ncbi:DUF1349 domain-containing protein [Rufibacter roseus]|uniref:DUF1349 domain-containing protein n=1 Tax=Rufibacter roseus TaxID=1567108 RepID=A0ABW2DMQ0_9BACT|nr:DUF1349 domain-containing protein [Rufibacter roseus]
MKTPFLLCLVLWLSFSSCLLAQKSANTTAVGFTVEAIPYPCQLNNGPALAKIVSPTSFTLLAPGETDLHNPASGAFRKSNAPMILFPLQKDFDLSVRVSPSHQNLYDGGGLLLWTDSGNWAKVLLQNTGEQSVLGLSVVRDFVTDDSYFQVGNKREVYLRMTRKGNIFVFYYSPDKKVWTVLRQFVYHRPEQMQAGFYAQSPKGPNCLATFSQISFSETK